MSRHHPSKPNEALTTILRDLSKRCPHPERLLELYYWSLDPELAEVMRQFIGLSASAQASLHAFLSIAQDNAGSIRITINERGELIMSSPQVAETVKGMTAMLREERAPQVH
jgi:hypothetical protein